VTHANAALRWLRRDPLIWAKSSWHSKASCRPTHCACEVVRRLRTLVKKTPDRNDRLDINETILEIIGLTRAEMQRNGVLLETQLATDLPSVGGDRIQLQP
jgi:C4-dicarboxylate-specific signal transduction histidine kinase